MWRPIARALSRSKCVGYVPYPLSPRMITFSKTFFRDAILARGKTKASVSNANKQ